MLFRKRDKTKPEVKKQRDARNRTPRRRLSFVAASALLAVCCLAGIFYLSSRVIRSAFPVQHVVFSGNKHLSDDELKAIAGINGNECLPAISGSRLGKRMLASPWIKQVSVRKEYPSTLSIAISESVPFALLDMDGHVFLVDDRGALLEELKGAPVSFLPVIRGDVFREKEGFSAALSLAKLMKNKGFSMEKNRIEIIAMKPQDLTVVIDGIVVKMGDGNHEDKLNKYISLEDEIRKRKIIVDYIDLRFENRVVVKPVNGVIE